VRARRAVLKPDTKLLPKWLQWSRARESAERVSFFSPFFNSAPLQWSRARESAESYRLRIVRVESTSFNGAALVRARRVGLRDVKNLSPSELQWSRARESAESPLRMDAIHAYYPASMEPRS